MNVFEDLIEELKEENLLEETVIETSKLESYYISQQSQLNNQTKESPFSNNQVNFNQENSETSNEEERVYSIGESFAESAYNQDFSTQSEISINGENEFETSPEAVVLKEQNIDSSVLENQFIESFTLNNSAVSEQIIKEEEELAALNVLAAQTVGQDNAVAETIESAEFEEPQFPEYELLSKSIISDSEFYRRRATEEVTSLQIVEHLISAIEKEQMKIVPKPYDDLPVSMALHDFLQISKEPHSVEHAQAEFKLMQETESWYSALSHRDKHISVGDLRRYCENAKPALSSQALVSLARFYRNSPFSESVRSKFDMVITRLMTKENWDESRDMVFTRDDLIIQLGNLYSDWSSIPLYESNEDDSDVLIAVLKFEDFMMEAAGAATFEDLIKNDFFNRIRNFKESTNEKFFAPLLTATAIECNVTIGNKYIKLLQAERLANKGSELEEKYKFLLDQSVSDAISKTVQLVELLKEKKPPIKVEVFEQPAEIKEVLKYEKSSAQQPVVKKPVKQSRIKFSKFSIAAIVLAVLSLAGLYFWAEFMTPQITTSPNVRKVDIEGTAFREYFKTARVNKETYYLITEPAWEKRSNDVKEDVLKKALGEGTEKGYNKIHVINSEGKTVAFASNQGITLDSK